MRLDLSARERQCLELIAEGLTDRLIGKRLHVSEETVSVYLRGLYLKLGARNRPHAVALGYQMGLLAA